MIFATETKFSKLWGRAKYREIHTGHFHKKDQIDYNPISTDGGVVIRRIPSLTGTDYWHYSNGYVANPRRAEMYIYDKKDGYVAQFSNSI